MFKRMSILARRAGDDRAYFARKWREHGEYIIRLPGLRGYIQNHVAAEVNPAGIAVDGIVELWFDTPAAMASAFQSEIAAEMRADEPGFLGQATGYALVDPSDPSEGKADVPKLFLIETEHPTSAREIFRFSEALSKRVDIVEQIIAKPQQALPPVSVARFSEVVFSSPASLAAAMDEADDIVDGTHALFQVDSQRLA